MKSKIAQQWLSRLTETANNKEHAAHMGLISKQVSLYGMPGIDVIAYDDWSAQCQHEFNNGILKNISYKGMKILVNSPGKLMFKTLETIESNDGVFNSMAVEMVIEKEADGVWRLTQERVLTQAEMEHDLNLGGYE